MYSLVTIVNTLYFIFESFKRVSLRSSHKKKYCMCDAGQTY